MLQKINEIISNLCRDGHVIAQWTYINQNDPPNHYAKLLLEWRFEGVT